MIRVLSSLVLAIAVIGAGAASAAHALAHDAPQVAHEMQDMETGHAVALAECCDAVGAKVGGSCFADVLPSDVLLLGPEPFAEAAIFPVRVVASPGTGTSVPTSPPKL